MYDLYHGDIFATNVFARDPYSGREVQLIDGRGQVLQTSKETY